MNIGLIIVLVILIIIAGVMIYPLIIVSNNLNNCINSENIICPTYTCEEPDIADNSLAFRIENGKRIYQSSVSISGKAA